ncbi:MAG: DUF2115 family protein [Eubacteriaceae bacterium]|nr:DUF2115 family protein [Eubacteriaceae bacterium]
MIISKKEFLDELRGALSEEERRELEDGGGAVISSFNRAVMKRLLSGEEVFEGDADTEEARELHRALSAYLEKYMPDAPRGHKWVILSCLFLSMAAREPMHPQPLTNWEKREEGYFCKAREDTAGSVCRWCVCQKL